MQKQKVNKCKNQTQAIFDIANEKSKNNAYDNEYILLQNNTKSTPNQTVQAKK